MTIEQNQQRQRLLDMLGSFVKGDWDLKTLYGRFYAYYADELRDNSLSDEDWEFFGTIHEKLDFVDESPDPRSRADGWISADEYRTWLRQRLSQSGTGR